MRMKDDYPTNRDNSPSCDGSPRANRQTYEENRDRERMHISNEVMPSPHRSSVEWAIERLEVVARGSQAMSELIRERFAGVLVVKDCSEKCRPTEEGPTMCHLGTRLSAIASVLEEEFAHIRSTIDSCDL